MSNEADVVVGYPAEGIAAIEDLMETEDGENRNED